MFNKIEDLNDFKEKFKLRFESFRVKDAAFNAFLMELLTSGTAYVVGGFLRDIINNKVSRDLDIIVDTTQSHLEELLKASSLNYSINRMLGVKIRLTNLEVDMWTLDNNWAFRTDVINRNEDYIIERIADGCFYNFDSLVINVHKGNHIHVRNYNYCVESKKLDILRKKNSYKTKNPTIEANILRAFFISKKFNVSFSDNCTLYLAKSIIKLKQQYGSALDRLNIYLEKYQKYKLVISNQDLIGMTNNIITESQKIESQKGDPSQFTINF